MNPKKVVILYAGAAHWGGVETYLEQLFINIDKKKLDLTLFSIGNWELCDRLEKAGYKVSVFPEKWYDYSLVSKIANNLSDGDFDLIAAQGLVANFFGRLSAKKAGIPNLITIHSDYKFDYHGYKRVLYGVTFRLFEGMTDKYITVSKFLEKEAIKLGVKKSKIKVIYNGVKDPFAGKNITQPKNGDTVVFGSLGRLHYKKGYQGLIKAAALLKDRNFKIYIWGTGEDKEDLKSLIQINNLSEKVTLAGFTKDIPGSLSQIDVYIQPSLEEGFGITVAEGMYAEKPVIVTPAGSLPELITDGKTGIIAHDFAPESIAAAMELVISNPELRERLGKAARKEAVERFGLDKWILEIEKTYLEAAK
jgi:glycosyltransferase involved in cell wall biosynthesis